MKIKNSNWTDETEYVSTKFRGGNPTLVSVFRGGNPTLGQGFRGKLYPGPRGRFFGGGGGNFRGGVIHYKTGIDKDH